MRLPFAALVLPLLLGACVEFVDPVGLGLARNARMELNFDVTDEPTQSACPGPARLAADSVVLCVTATVTPGINRLGERYRVLDDTLRAMGVPLTPSTGPDGEGTLRYQRRFTLPLASLEEIPITAVLPRLEGVEIAQREIRWFAVGRADPDTLFRTATEGVRFHLDPPGGRSTPAPGYQFWRVDVAGDTAVVGYNAFGVPRSTYDFPAEVLAALGGPRQRAELWWNRTYSPGVERLSLNVSFLERLSWTILRR